MSEFTDSINIFSSQKLKFTPAERKTPKERAHFGNKLSPLALLKKSLDSIYQFSQPTHK